MKTIKNNLYVLKYVIIFCPVMFVWALFQIASSVVIAVSKVELIKETINLVINGEDIKIIFNAIALYLIIIVVTSLFRMFYTYYIYPRYRVIYTKKMQHFLFTKVKHIDMEMFDNPQFYDNYSRALRDGTWMGLRVYETLIRFLTSTAIVIALGFMISKDLVLLVIILASSIINVLVVNKINKSWYLWGKETEKEKRMYDYVNRTFYRQQFAGEIKTTNISSLLINKYTESADIINDKYAKTYKKLTVYNVLLNVIKVIIERGLINFYLAFQLFKDIISIATFTSTLNATLQFSSNFVDAMNLLTTLKENSLFIDDFRWLVNYKGNIENRDGILVEDFEKVSVENISFKYENTEYFSINDLSLSIKKGEKVAIVGLNGSGKTTLTKLILDFYLPSMGYLKLNDIEYQKINQRNLRNKYAVVFQDFQIYALSIGENILMRKVENQEDEQKVWNALEMVGMSEKIKSLEKGIHTEVTREFNRNGAVFSGGEIQRIAIARVFASNADLYILDEPTSALDPLSEERINKLIIKNTQKAMIIIAHRLSTVVDCDRIYLMNKGKIEECGTHEELIASNGLYAKMFNTQKSLYQKQ